MHYIIFLAIVAILIYCSVVYVIPGMLAVAVVAAIVILLFAAIVGAWYATKNYAIAIKEKMNFVEWEWEASDEPAKRSYFFGPGYRQLWETIKRALELNVVEALDFAKLPDKLQDSKWNPFAVLVYALGAKWSILLFSPMLCSLLAIIHGTATLLMMCATYAVFSIVWLIDYAYLQYHKIRSDCPVCHRHFLIPHFICPECGRTHKQLVPGVYGVFSHTCTCGKKLPSTFFNGRSTMADAICPECGQALVASDVRPIVFQLVGGPNSGKTVFLAAFFQEYLGKLAAAPNLEYSIDDSYREYFRAAKSWAEGGKCPSTEQKNSQMYPMVIESKLLNTKRQFSIYDVAGEIFSGNESVPVAQRQFHYCDGILFVLDPFSSGELRENRMSDGAGEFKISNAPAADVANSLINYMVEINVLKPGERTDRPVAVMIAKSDAPEVMERISPAKIQAALDSGAYNDYAAARDGECEKFLRAIGMSNAVDCLMGSFTNLHFFPVSAIGHFPDGTPYRPWGITEPVDWLMRLSDEKLYRLIEG